MVVALGWAPPNLVHAVHPMRAACKKMPAGMIAPHGGCGGQQRTNRASRATGGGSLNTMDGTPTKISTSIITATPVTSLPRQASCRSVIRQVGKRI